MPFMTDTRHKQETHEGLNPTRASCQIRLIQWTGDCPIKLICIQSGRLRHLATCCVPMTRWNDIAPLDLHGTSLKIYVTQDRHASTMSFDRHAKLCLQESEQRNVWGNTHTNTHTLYMASSWRKSYLYSLYSLFRVAEILLTFGREPRYKIFLLFTYQCYCNKFNMSYKIWTHTNTCLTEMHMYADTHRLTRVFTNTYIYIPIYIYGCYQLLWCWYFT